MKKKRILIVDDYRAELELMKEILDYEGYQTMTASCGEEALQLNHGDFDLLLTDIVMPNMGGLELVQAFRQLSPNTVPMLITGFPSIETAQAAAEQGVYDYIVKPFDRHRLCSAVSGALKRKCAMAFSDRVLRKAWRSSGGRCECKSTTHDHYGICNVPLVWGNIGREGQGKWQEHSKSGLYEDSVKDCQLLCWGCYTLTFQPSKIKIDP